MINNEYLITHSQTLPTSTKYADKWRPIYFQFKSVKFITSLVLYFFSSLLSIRVCEWASLWPPVCFHSGFLPQWWGLCSASSSFSIVNSVNTSCHSSVQSSSCALTVLHAAAGERCFVILEIDQRLQRHSCKFVGGSSGGKPQIPTDIKHRRRPHGAGREYSRFLSRLDWYDFMASVFQHWNHLFWHWGQMYDYWGVLADLWFNEGFVLIYHKMDDCTC